MDYAEYKERLARGLDTYECPECEYTCDACESGCCDNIKPKGSE